jgi:hypothetical protein
MGRCMKPTGMSRPPQLQNSQRTLPDDHRGPGVRRRFAGGADCGDSRARACAAHVPANRSRQPRSSVSSPGVWPRIQYLGVISQPTANYNYDKTGVALPNGDPVRRKYATDEYELYVQDS